MSGARAWLALVIVALVSAVQPALRAETPLALESDAEVLARARPALRACFARGASTPMTANVLVLRSGRVDRVELTPRPRDRRLGACVQGVLRAARFEPRARATTITVPLNADGQ